MSLSNAGSVGKVERYQVEVYVSLGNHMYATFVHKKLY